MPGELNALDRHAGLPGSDDEGFAKELWAVLGPQYLRQSRLRLQPVENPDQSLGVNRVVHLDVYGLTVEGVNYVERLLFAPRQRPTFLESTGPITGTRVNFACC